MPPVGFMSRFVELLTHGDAASFGSAGLLLAALLILVLRVVLPEERRGAIRWPFLALVLYVVVVGVRASIAPEVHWQKPLEVFALFVLLISIGRALFLVGYSLLTRQRRARAMPKIIGDIVQAVIYACVGIVTLRAAGVEPTSLLTTSALLTAVVGLSLQDTLGNLFAGLSMQLQRAFEVGDWIQFDADPAHVGRVVEINWRAIRLITLDETEITVPNSMLAKGALSNFTKPTPIARRNIFVTVPFGISPGRVHATILEAVRGAPGTAATPEPSVVTKEFAENGVVYWLRFFTTEYGRRDVIDGVVRDRVWYALERMDIPMARPLREVAMRAPDEDLRGAQRRIDDRAAALRAVDVLRPLSNAATVELASAAATRLYAPGETIIRQGEEGSELFIVLRGEVAVRHRANDDDTQEVTRLGPGKFFGEMSLMTGERRSATIRAVTESELLIVDQRTFKPILSASPEVATAISELLARRATELDERIQTASERPTRHDEKSGLILRRIKEFFSL